MSRRIYATVTEDDFHTFLWQAKALGLTMGEALAAVAHAYCLGEIDITKHIAYYENVCLTDKHAHHEKPDMEFDK